MIEPHKTSYTLLQRAVDRGDDEAWDQLVEHYRRFIYYVLHRLNANACDVDDLTQQVLIRVLNSLKNFDRSKGRFRTWLSTIIRNTAVTHFQRNAAARKRIDILQAEGGFGTGTQAPEIDAYIEQEWNTYIATQAMERVRARSHGQAMDVFELALDGWSASEISGKTGLTISSVYTLKKRVKKQLYLEVLELTSDLEP